MALLPSSLQTTNIQFYRPWRGHYQVVKVTLMQYIASS